MPWSTANRGRSAAQREGVPPCVQRDAQPVQFLARRSRGTLRSDGVHPVLFRVGEVAVYSYGVMMVVALGAGFVALLLAALRLRYSLPGVALLGCLLPATMVFGAKVGWRLGHLDELEREGWLGGGMALVPALVLSLAAAGLVGLLFKEQLGATLDVVVIGLSMSVGVGRLGCFLAGCCVGKPTSMPWGLVFPTSTLIPETLHEVPLHPTQLYALVLFTLLSIVLLWRGPKRRFSGELTLVAIVVFGVVSMAEPFVRLDEPHVPFKVVAWLLVVLAALAATVLLGRRAAPAATA